MRFILQIIHLFIWISIATGHFGYKKCQQHTWVEKFKSCGGKLQSPIAIISSKTIPIPLPALEMIGYRNFLPGPLLLKNSGHSVTIKSHVKSERSAIPYIFGAAFDKNHEYEMDHLHFHWGRRNSRGSEHTLNGIRYPMEMHIVHRNMVYKNVSHALNFKDGLAVLGVFFQLQEEDNELLKPILNQLPGVQELNKEVQLNGSIVLSLLMPQNIDLFYIYKGSLTTPPCSEVVTWIIFPTPVPISFRQMNKFRILSSDEGRLGDNYRKLQEIGKRKVYVRRWSPAMVTQYNATPFNTTSLTWF